MKCNVGVRGIVQKNGKFLLVQRADKQRHGGHWEFPGGKTDCRDSRIAIKREVREETGLRLNKVKFVQKRKDGKYMVKYYKGNAEGKVKIQPSEVQGFGWFTRSQAKKLNLVKHTRRLI